MKYLSLCAWSCGLALLAPLRAEGPVEGQPYQATLADGSATLVFVPIPSGSFLMGSPPSEAGRYNNESPRTRVTISKAFWLGRTSVTQKQWKALMGTDVVEQARRMLADDTLHSAGGEKTTLRDFKGLQKTLDPMSTVVATVADDAPMYFVSWEEAAAFCRRLTDAERAAGHLPTGYEYRLPTEAEWEYACRAGTTTATYAGDLDIKGQNNAPVLDPIAWYGGNSSVGYTGDGFGTAKWPEKQHPGGTAGQRIVATKRPNGWGLHDMLGNVWQWCGDWYGKLPGGDVVDPQGAASGSFRVNRGGSWNYIARDCRAASRAGDGPGIRYDFLGFRVALSPVR